MKMHRQIVTMLGVLVALNNTQNVYGMQKIHDYFSKSSPKKEESQTQKDDSRIRPSSDSREEKSSPRQSREQLNKTLGELFPAESARSSTRGESSRDRESQSSEKSRSLLQSTRDKIFGKKTETEREIVISGPTEFRKTTDEALARMKPADAQMIRDAQQTRDAQEARKAQISAATEGVQWNKNTNAAEKLRATIAQDSVKIEDQIKSKEQTAVFRKTTNDALSKMKPEDAQMIRDTQAQEARKAQISAATEGVKWNKNTPASEKLRAEIAQETQKINLQLESKEQEKRYNKLAEAVKSSKNSDLTPEVDPKKQIQIEKITTEKNNLMGKLNETRDKIKTEEKKADANRDDAALKKLYLEKKKLGDQLSVKSKALESATNQMNLTSLSSKDLLNEVNLLQTKSIAAQKSFEQANKEQIEKQANLKSALNSLPAADKKKYKELSAAHKEIEDKIQDKTTPNNQINQLVEERKAIKKEIGNINQNLLVQHDNLLNHEATFITAKKDAELAQRKTQIAASILEQRLEKEAEAAKKPDIESKPKKSARFNLDGETSDNQTKKEYDPTAVPAKGILKKSVGFSEPQEQTKTTSKSSLPSIDQKSLAEFEKKASPPPSTLPPLPSEKNMTDIPLTPAMRKIANSEEAKFKERTSTKKPSLQEESFSPVKFD